MCDSCRSSSFSMLNIILLLILIYVRNRDEQEKRVQFDWYVFESEKCIPHKTFIEAKMKTSGKLILTHFLTLPSIRMTKFFFIMFYDREYFYIRTFWLQFFALVTFNALMIKLC